MRGAAEGKKLERGAIRAMISSLLAAFFGQWRERETRGGCNEIANSIRTGGALYLFFLLLLSVLTGMFLKTISLYFIVCKLRHGQRRAERGLLGINDK